MNHSVPRSVSRCLAVLSIATLLGACSSAQLVETVTVLKDNNCVNVESGITESSLAELKTLRRSRLLPAPDDAPLKPEDALPDLETTRVYVVSKGPQPTPGYALELQQARLEGNTLTLAFNWQTPPDDAVLAQVLTHPCIAIGIPNTEADVLVAIDQNGEFARLTL